MEKTDPVYEEKALYKAVLRLAPLDKQNDGLECFVDPNDDADTTKAAPQKLRFVITQRRTGKTWFFDGLVLFEAHANDKDDRTPSKVYESYIANTYRPHITASFHDS